MPRKQKKYHFIYKTTNEVNGKFYVGMHSTDDLDDGYIGSGKYLWNSIRKYGRENFRIEILESFESRGELKKREEELVNEDMLKDPLCMNLRKGGEGGLLSYEHGLKLSRAGAAKIKWLKENDKEFADKRRKFCIENLKKYGDSFPIGHTIWKNRKHKVSTKKIMSDKAKLRTGNKNSQYGTCWIMKEGKNLKIKLNELEKYIQNGWIKGRKIKDRLL